jgi:hypothetical protein
MNENILVKNGLWIIERRHYNLICPSFRRKEKKIITDILMGKKTRTSAKKTSKSISTTTSTHIFHRHYKRGVS